MTDIVTKVVPDSYIAHKWKVVGVIVLCILLFSVVYSLLTRSILMVVIELMISSMIVVACFYAENVRRPVRMRITDDGITLHFRRLRPRFIPWRRIFSISRLKQIPKMRGVMPTRGAISLRDKSACYFIDEHSVRLLLDAYTEVFGLQPRIMEQEDDGIEWEIDVS